MKWEAIFFDCDGVILDSANTKTRAFEKIFLPYGEKYMREGVNYHLQNVGISRFEKFRYFYSNILKTNFSETDIQKMGILFSKYALDEILNAQFIEGAIDTIKELHHMSIPIYVVSGTPNEELKIIFNKKNLTHYFHEIHGSPRTKILIINDILFRNSYHYNNCLFIGDAMTDYHAAAKTRLNFIGIVAENDRSPFPDGTVTHSKILINHLLNF